MATLVAIESPYAQNGVYNIAQNVLLAQRACKYAVHHGYNPYAMHLFYPQFLDENDPKDRKLGINLGLQMIDRINPRYVWFIIRSDMDFSPGMTLALTHHTAKKRIITIYTTNNNGETFTINS